MALQVPSKADKNKLKAEKEFYMEGKFYPDPMMMRESWIALNGEWSFAFDDENRGIREDWSSGHDFSQSIKVPFAYQCKASGIADTGYHPVLWYEKRVDLTDEMLSDELLLAFNAVDYKASVWVNGHHAADHTGGYSRFSVPVRDLCVAGKNRITVRVEDYNDTAQPRGKQIWTENTWGCWYIPTSGIWQDVWLVKTGRDRISGCMITPDLDNRTATFFISYPETNSDELELGIEVAYKGKIVHRTRSIAERYRQEILLYIKQPNSVDDIHAWSPESPELYEVCLTLYNNDGKEVDRVRTHFGMRKISVHNGQIMLNNRPFYQRLILDQGYWPDSHLTAPSKEAIMDDLRKIKAMGFNGLRMHQKFEDPYLYYFADQIGLVVWGELPSAYEFTFDENINLIRDMAEGVRNLYNHPSIIMWVPLNESWGVRDIFIDRKEQEFSESMYHMLKAIDPSRLVSSNDGWEQTISDISAIHDYLISDEESFRIWRDKNRLMSTAAGKREIYAEGYEYCGEPVILTEFGGIALLTDVERNKEAWGYLNPADDKEELIARLEKLFVLIYSDEDIKGFCYTQLTDVQQEVNGLLDSRHEPKCDLSVIASIVTNRY